MEFSVYHRLQERLDVYSVGYPASESRTEIKILEKLFTEEEAQLFLLLGPTPSTDEAVAAQLGRSRAEVRSVLDGIYKKGLIYRHVKGETFKYGTIPFLEGILENHVRTMDGELAHLFETYFEEALHNNVVGPDAIGIHRTIPVNQAIPVSYPMPTYDNSRAIISNQKVIAVTDCLCRVQQGLIDKGCDKPLETCLMFGPAAQAFVDRGMGRFISAEEALKILDECEAAGHVTQPYNSQTPMNLCNCCPDCCVVLRKLKTHPRPAEVVGANYRAAVDPEMCDACDLCLERCPTDAIRKGEIGVEGISQERCIGCGLCVSACPTGALILESRPEAQRREPPETGQRLQEEMAARRGIGIKPSGVERLST